MTIEEKRIVFIDAVCVDPTSPSAIINARREECLACENLTDTYKCKECNCGHEDGCYLPAFHKVIGAKCPIGKW